jgi:hypothetical protein
MWLEVIGIFEGEVVATRRCPLPQTKNTLLWPARLWAVARLPGTPEVKKTRCSQKGDSVPFS